jgi:hypothetical protein
VTAFAEAAATTHPLTYWLRRQSQSVSRPSSSSGDKTLDLAPDFDEFCGLLTAHGVEFVIVGAHALNDEVNAAIGERVILGPRHR